MEEVVLLIERLAAGGDGVGRAPDGRVVFVPLTAPGDRARVALLERRPRFARGELRELIEPGPDRVEPRCPVFGSCGGCSWQQLAYPAQLEAKTAILRDALERIGHLRLPGELRVTPSPRAYGYRGRTRVRVAGGRVGYRRRRSHELCPVEACPVLLPELDARLRALAQDPPPEDGERELASATLGVGPDRMGVSAGVFAQSNALLLDALVGSVLEAAGRGSFALELYAGAGFFTLGLARRFEKVLAVESDPRAVADLRSNLAVAGLANVEVLERRVEDAPLARQGPAVVVLDPPRAGLPTGCVDTLAGLGAERIVYLSCDPATLARDLAGLCARGLRLCSVEGFDLFPQTAHVEALALLEPEDATPR